MLTQARGNTSALGPTGPTGYVASVLLSSPVPLRLPVRAFARSSTSLCFHKFQHICPVPTVSPFRRGTKITPTTQHIKVSASACCRPALGRPPPQWSLNSATTTTATQPPPTTHTNTHTHTRATGNVIPPHHHHRDCARLGRRTYPTSSPSDQGRRAADMPTRRCHHRGAQGSQA